MVYCEEYPRIDEAFYREKQVHGWSRKKKEALIEGFFEKLPALSKNYTQFGNPSLRQAQGTDDISSKKACRLLSLSKQPTNDSNNNRYKYKDSRCLIL